MIRRTVQLGALASFASCGRFGFDTARLADAVTAVDDAQPIDALPPVDALLDAAVCPAAPPGCAQFQCGGSSECYYACATLTTWPAARDACVAQGLGCLATIDDVAEDTCMQASPVGNPWIGFVQTTKIEPAGGWTWQCGTSTYVAWRGTEPNDQGGNEDCAVSTTTGWVDLICTSPQPYVCERAP